jgi:hypothetical protein
MDLLNLVQMSKEEAQQPDPDKNKSANLTACAHL